MKIFKYIGITILTIIIVLVFASTSLTVRNFYAHAGILSPVGTTKYALPFAQNMTVSFLNVIVLLSIGLTVAIIVDIASQVLYTWEGGANTPPPTKETPPKTERTDKKPTPSSSPSSASSPATPTPTESPSPSPPSPESTPSTPNKPPTRST